MKGDFWSLAPTLCGWAAIFLGCVCAFAGEWGLGMCLVIGAVVHMVIESDNEGREP